MATFPFQYKATAQNKLLDLSTKTQATWNDQGHGKDRFQPSLVIIFSVFSSGKCDGNIGGIFQRICTNTDICELVTESLKMSRTVEICIDF